MTEVHPDPQGGASPPADAVATGAELRRAREARGETAADVAHALKLTARQVEAMEAGRLDLLPGPAFARGFVRNYARYLGLDPAAVLRGFRVEAAASAVELVPVSNAEGVMPSGGASRAAQFPAALVAGVLLLVVIAGWYFDWFQVPEETVAVVEPAPAVPAPGAGGVPAVVQPLPATAAGTAPDAGAAAVAPPAPSAPSSPMPPAAAGAVPPPVATPVAVAPPAPAAAPAGEAPRADGVEHLVFRFRGEAWIEVRDASGAIVYSGINTAGSSRTVQGKPPFALVIGNARQVSLDYRGKPYDLSPHVRVSVARLTLE